MCPKVGEPRREKVPASEWRTGSFTEVGPRPMRGSPPDRLPPAPWGARGSPSGSLRPWSPGAPRPARHRDQTRPRPLKLRPGDAHDPVLGARPPATMEAAPDVRIEPFYEHLDAGRFQGSGNARPFFELLRAKYSNTAPEAIVALGALPRPLLSRGRALFPESPSCSVLCGRVLSKLAAQRT